MADPLTDPAITPEPPDEAAQAQAARETAAQHIKGTVKRAPRAPVVPGLPPVTPKDEDSEDPDNVYARFGAGDDDGLDLTERFRLNEKNSFYRGTLTGAATLSSLAYQSRTEDGPDDTPVEKERRAAAREEYRNVIADLARHDLMAPWGTTAEAAVALGGTLVGSLPTPESLAALPARGATMLARTGWAALQTGALFGAIDPVVQGLNIHAGVEQHYDPMRTAMAFGIGAILGGGIHIGGEWVGGMLRNPQLIGNEELKKMLRQIAEEDTAAFKPQMDMEAPSGRRTDGSIDSGERPGPNAGGGAEGETGGPHPLGGAEPREAPGGEAGPAPVAEAAAVARPDERTVLRFDKELSMYNPDGGTPRVGHQYEIADAKGNKAGEVAVEELDGGKRLEIIWIGKGPEEGGIDTKLDLGTGAVRSLLAELRNLYPEAQVLSGFRQGGAHKGATKDIVLRLPDTTVARRGGDGEMYAVSVPRSQVRATDEVIPQVSRETSGPKELTAPIEVSPDTSPELALAQRAGGGALPMERSRPDAGTPSSGTAGTSIATVPATASPTREGAVRSLQQQVSDLARVFDIPIREGRITAGKNVLGVYKTGSGVVRVREYPDFEAAVHEVAHGIEARVGQDLTNLIEASRIELAPLVSNPAAYDPAMHAKEGFAEYVRRYVGNPAHANMVAPNFTTAFRTFMEQRAPQMLEAIDNASVAYRAYLEAPSVDAIGAVKRSKDEGPKGWRKWLPRKIQDEGFPVIVKTVMQEMVTGQVDQYAPTARALRDMLKSIKDSTGQLVDLKAADNPEVLLRMFAQAQQAAVGDLMQGVRGWRSITPEGPSLADAIGKATGSSRFGRWNAEKLSDFEDYLISRRALVLWDRFNQGNLERPPTPFSRGDAAVALAEFERANPTFREGSDMVHAWTRQLLKKQHEGGLIDVDLYNRLLKEEFYVPFMRDLSDKPTVREVGGYSGAPGDRVAETIHKIRGSSRDIKSPIESLMTQAFLVNRTLRHNDIIRAFVDVAEQAGIAGGKYVEKIPANEAKRYTFDLQDSIERVAKERGMSADDTKVLTSSITDVFGPDPVVGSFFRMEPAGARGEPIVFYKEGGQLKAARFMSGEEGHAVYENLTQLPPALNDLSMQLLSTSSTVLRSGITTNPVYALTNYIRDQMATAILRPDYIPFLSGMKGVVDEVRQGQSAQLYAYMGGISAGTAIAPLEKAIQLEVNALAKQGYVVSHLTSLQGLADLASVTEAGTRNSVFDTVFKQKRAMGLSEYEAAVEAAYQARDLMDFGRWGSKTLAVRRLTPFVNAHIQGLSKAYRTLLEPLWKEALTTGDAGAKGNAILGITKVLGIGGALGAGWAALHYRDEIYQNASPEMKGTHFVTTIGNKILMIPKPFELSLGFTAGEYAFQRLMKNDQRAALQFAEASYEVLMPPVPIGANPLIKTSWELLLGKSSYFGRDIVPDTMKRLAPAEQYTDRTSSFSRSLGQATGMSPMKIDYAIGGFFGTWGRDMMALSSGVDQKAPAQNWDDMVFLRRFIKDPTRSSDVVTQFWKFMGQTSGQYNQAKATFDTMNKQFRDDTAKQFLNNLPEGQRAYVILQSAADENGKAKFNADDKRLFPLQRAYDAVGIVNGLRRELTDNTFKTFEEGKNIQFSPRQRRDMIDSLRELGQMEMRNSFVIMKEQGYVGRPLFDVKPVLDKIRAISPQVAEEVATRYATGRVYSTASVAASYERLKSEVLRNGSSADVSELTSEAKAEGYEFGGERVRKPQKRRVLIEPSSLPGR